MDVFDELDIEPKMPSLDNFTVQVIVDGHPANEYDDDNDEPDASKPRHITKYVEAVSGKKFKFKVFIKPNYRFREEEDLISVRVYLDGKWAGGVCFAKAKFSPIHGGSVEKCGHYIGDGDSSQLLEYAFADLETRESKSLLFQSRSTNAFKATWISTMIRRR